MSADTKEKQTFSSGIFRITEIETILSNDNYIEKEFLLEKNIKEKTATESCCGLDDGRICPTPAAKNV